MKYYTGEKLEDKLTVYFHIYKHVVRVVLQTITDVTPYWFLIVLVIECMFLWSVSNTFYTEYSFDTYLNFKKDVVVFEYDWTILYNLS